MDIQVGEYIRTKNGVIAKVIEVTPNYVRKEDGFKVWFHADKEIKHSFNITDLIEGGDFADGYKVEEFYDEEGNMYLGIPIYDDGLMDCIVEVLPIDEIGLKEILTHEMYEKNSYKVME